MRPTEFEKKILNDESYGKNQEELNRIQVLNKNTRQVLKKNIIANIHPTYSSTESYQKIYRQFNRSNN